ncbi:MAG: hypothetical protein QXE31_03580 [Candidatus Woesearchaeota archaeon]
MAKKLEIQCPDENIFWLCNGKTLKTIKELLNELKVMEESVFKYHVNDEKDDFANWLKDIFNEFELVDKLKGVKDKNKYIEIMELYYYPKKETKKQPKEKKQNKNTTSKKRTSKKK